LQALLLLLLLLLSFLCELLLELLVPLLDLGEQLAFSWAERVEDRARKVTFPSDKF
jgi:hypothetical protein